MPIYEYQCKKCGHEFEHLARTLAESLPPCPKCGAEKLEKKFSTFSASVASAALTPCSEGGCPAGATPGGCCSGGRCPL